MPIPFDPGKDWIVLEGHPKDFNPPRAWYGFTHIWSDNLWEKRKTWRKRTGWLRGDGGFRGTIFYPDPIPEYSVYHSFRKSWSVGERRMTGSTFRCHLNVCLNVKV